MDAERNYVLSIAGFDPSGGAGVLADIKTFMANKTCGMGVVSANTFQNDKEFDGLNWIKTEEILQQITVLLRRFEFNAVKIGLIQDLDTLETIVSAFPESTKIIWDPIIKASAGFEFHKSFDRKKLISVLEKIYLITPNTEEAVFLSGNDEPFEGAVELSNHSNVLLKGGHSDIEKGVDYLITKGGIDKISGSEVELNPKHGSGCVLSSAISSHIAKGNDLLTSCRLAKNYVEQFLSSNKTLLGVHHA
jgi:hydroxymethylpyrimidine/phosphomethylpyrimidine kinase